MSAVRTRLRGWLARRVGLSVAALTLGLAVWFPPLSLRRAVPDAVVVFDITQSMETLDGMAGGAISRLSVATQALANALPQLPCGSRLGIGIFTEYRTLLLLAPVDTCNERTELLDTIAHIDGRMAWAGSSEIAKGLFSALRSLQELADPTALVFITDGHEAPPINPRHRPGYGGKPDAIDGLIVGVGGTIPMPIPKFDPAGRPIGFWRADDVLQTDLYTAGRQGSVVHEAMVDSAAESQDAPPVAAALHGSPGREHLSSLHSDYLELLAAETHLGYARLDPDVGLTRVLGSQRVMRMRVLPYDLKWLFGAAALLALVLSTAPPRPGGAAC